MLCRRIGICDNYPHLDMIYFGITVAYVNVYV
jgi:hypothetical protein